VRRLSVPPLLPAVLSLALVVGAGGCSTGEPLVRPDFGTPRAEAADPVDDQYADFDAIQDLLDVRARALLRGDRRAFMATVDRGTTVRRRQSALFDNLQVLPVEKLYYGVERNAMVPDEVRGGGKTLRPPVVEHVQITGVNKRPVSNDVSMTFVQRGDRWLLGSEREDESFQSQSRPWYGARIETAGDSKLLVVTDRGAKVDADELLGQTRSALAAVTGVLDRQPTEPLLVDATTNGAATELSNSSGEDAAAVSYTTFASDRLGADYIGDAGQVVKANPDYVTQLVENDETLRHELTHYVLSGYGRSNPQWVTEGIAEYVGYQPGTLAQSYITDERLERLIDEREVRLTPPGRWGDEPELDYLSAEAFTEFLVARNGLEQYLEMMDLFERLARSRSVIYGEGIVDEVLKRIYGFEPGEVARGGFDLLQGL
jgi:hypothetical protein